MATRAATRSAEAFAVRGSVTDGATDPPAPETVCIGKNTYTQKAAFEQQKSMYTLGLFLHESPSPSPHPRDDRSRAAPQPGDARAPAPAARLRGDAGHDFARHQGARARQTLRRRRLPAPRRGDDRSGNRAHGARARRE